MVTRLRDIVEESEPTRNRYLNARRAAHFAARAKQASTSEEGLPAVLEAAIENIRSGKTHAGLAMLQRLRENLQRRPDPRNARFLSAVRYHLVTGFLRLAEERNCVAHHGPDSCLMPTPPGGVHLADRRPAEAAIRELRAELQANPQRLDSRWLLNLAHMLLGNYPDQVAPEHLIPIDAFKSKHDISRFRDIAPAIGLDVVGLSGGVVLEDLDGDLDLDVMCSSWGLADPLRCLRNEGDGRFVDITDAAGLTGLTGGLNLIHADYDNDGDVDVFVLRGAWLGEEGCIPNSLLANQGDGTFADVTEAVGLLSHHPTQTAAFADFDGDGRLDLFIGNETSGDIAHPCELFRGRADGTFVECAQAMGVAVTGMVKGVAWGDYDDDGRPDLYVSRHGTTNILFRNEGAKGFSNQTEAAGVAYPLKSFPTWFFDYDNDGRLDLWVMNYDEVNALSDVVATYLDQPGTAEGSRLYRNVGGGRFEDVTEAMGLDDVRLAMGSNFGDLDNDGHLDIAVGNGEPILRTLIPNRVFRNDGGQRFQDVTTSGGFGHVQKGHGIAFGDVDHDGDQDIYMVIGGAYEADTFRNALYLNPGHGNRRLTVILEGTRSNRSAIGARLTVEIETKTGTVRTIHRRVGTGGSFGSSTLRQEIGLGQAVSIRSLNVKWPSGATTSLNDLEVDQTIRVKEDQIGFDALALPRIELAPPVDDEGSVNTKQDGTGTTDGR